MKAQVLNFQQGTPEWHDHRANHFNASDASAMIGVSPYKSRNDLLQEKKTGFRPDIDPFTQKRFDQGHEYEAIARPWAEEIIGAELFPASIAADVRGMPLAASLDGITMDEKTTWEHKTLNDSLRESLFQGVIPDEYHWQIEQGLLLSGAERCLFMASNGDKESMLYAWYERSRDTAMALISGWAQFKVDLDAFEPVEKKVEPVAQVIRDLPALHIQITGSITTSNLAEYQAAAVNYISSINTELVTDQDFADAEADVKFCEAAEKKLEQVKIDALSQTKEIDDLLKTIDYINEELRQKRLTLNKLVTTEKQNRKIQIASAARDAYLSHIIDLEGELGGLKLTTAPEISWNDVLKNKRTIESLQNAADTALAQAKIEANEAAKSIRCNLGTLSQYGDEYQHLFSDLQSIIIKPADDFALIVETRIREENDRREAERQRAEQQAQEQQVPVTFAVDPAKPGSDHTEIVEPVHDNAEVRLEQDATTDFDATALLSDLTEWRDNNRVSKKAMTQLYDLIFDHFNVHVI